MFEFVIKNGIMVTVIILMICLFGALAIFRVPIQMIPDLDVRAISVRTRWTGASPQDVEKEIIIEQEEYLRAIPGLQRVISTAKTGEARIELEFPHGTNINEVMVLVNNALAQVDAYPENVDQPRIITSSFSNTAFMYFRVQALPGNPKNLDMELMLDFVEDTIKPQFEQVSGVSQADVWGGTRRQVRIYIDPGKLAAKHISLEQLRQAIRLRNQDLSGGDLDSGKRRYLLRTIGRFRSTADIENMVIAQRSNSPVYLRDVGHAEMGRFEPTVKSYANGRPNITVGIRRQTGANVMTVMQGVMQKMHNLNEQTLKSRGLQIQLTSEDVQYIKNAVGIVQKNLMIGALLAAAVLFLFLRSTAATLIGACGIPICTIAAFIGLLISGRTINVISLAGVAFAIGMTLDNSIVVLENIYRHLDDGKSRIQAALLGVSEVWPAVLASTLTTVLVFIPVLFITLEAGQLYSDIAIAIGAAIIVSMIVAITVVPSACSRYLSPHQDSSSANRSSQVKQQGWDYNKHILALVQWLLQSLTRRLACLALILTLTVAIIVGLMPKAEYLPEGEESKTFTFMFAPPGYNLSEILQHVEQMHDWLVPYLQHDAKQFTQQQTDVPALKFIVTYARTQSILFIIETKAREHIDALIKILSAKFSQVPGMLSFSSRGSIFASNMGGTRSINLDIQGAELEPLFATGFDVFKRAKSVFEKPQVRPQPSNLTLGQPLLEVHPNWERVAEQGLNVQQLGYIIRAFSDGAYVDEFYLGDQKIDMYLHSSVDAIKTPENIDKLSIYTPQGRIVPLTTLASVVETVSTETIRRVDAMRTVTLSIVPPRNIALETAVNMVKRDIIQQMHNSGAIPDGVAINISGASDRLEATRQALSGNFLVAILIAYLLLVAIFKHWGYPLIIMTTVPLGISGGIAGLWLFNLAGSKLELIGLQNITQPFDMLTMLGFLILIGTVVNNPILIVEKALHNFRTLSMPANTAILESVRLRLRPIIMSSATTILGLSPLVFLPGEGTELYRGIGIIVMFGILFSTLITLFFMPTLLSLIFSRTKLNSANKTQLT